MIIKFFEKEKIEKIGLDFYLVYGDNEGQKKEVLESILKNFNGLTKKYDEKEFLENKNEILSSLLNQSFFEDNKAFIIFRSTDKSLEFIEEILEKKITDTKIILLSERLDKKSKIRNFFEKSKSTWMCTCLSRRQQHFIENCNFAFQRKPDICFERMYRYDCSKI